MSSKSINVIRLATERVAVRCSSSLLQNGSLQRILPAASTTAARTITSVTGSVSSKPLHPPIQIINSSNSKYSFSSSAAEQQEQEESSSNSTTASNNEKKTPRKSRIPKKRKDPLIITPAAADRIKELLASPNGQGAIGIRLGVKRRGCNGLSYTMNYATERKRGEEEMEAHGVRVMIEPMALFNVVGTEMDWVETDMTSEFTFQNPNSKGECGCGESFNV